MNEKTSILYTIYLTGKNYFMWELKLYMLYSFRVNMSCFSFQYICFKKGCWIIYNTYHIYIKYTDSIYIYIYSLFWKGLQHFITCQLMLSSKYEHIFLIYFNWSNFPRSSLDITLEEISNYCIPLADKKIYL